MVASEDESDDQAGGAASDSAASSATLTEGWTKYQDTCEYKLDDNGCLTLRPLGGGDYAEINTLGVIADRLVADLHVSNAGDQVKSFEIQGSVAVLGKVPSGYSESSQKSFGLCNSFNGLKNLEAVDISGLVTPSDVSMQGMFYGCSSLASVKMPKALRVMDLNSTFYGCSSLASLDATGLVTANPVDATELFSGCSSLVRVELPTSICLSDATYMFSGCSKLQSLDVSGLVTSDEISTMGMFQNCSSIAEIKMPETLRCANAPSMFLGCSALSALNLASLVCSSYASANRMFAGCSSLESLELPSSFRVCDCGWMFSGCAKLASIDVSCLETAGKIDASKMFNGCSSLVSLKLPSSFPVSRTDWMFDECESLVVLDLSSLETTSAVNGECMFSNCSSLESLQLPSEFKITSGWAMFSGCSSLATIDVNSLDASEATDFSFMFSGCSGLEALDLSSLSVSKSVKAFRMFYNCSDLVSLRLPTDFKITNGDGMFSGLTSVRALDLSNLDTTAASSMENMFARTFPTSIKVGENFRFEGNYASQRICEFPNGWWTYDQSGIVYTGKWVSSVDGKTYDASKLPSSVSATYTVLIIEIPSGLTATYGQSLSEVELPEGFSWADSSLSVGFPGTREFDLNWQLDTNHSKLTNLKTTVVVGPAAIDSSMFKLKSAALCYTGEAIEPVVSSDVVPEGSYTVTYLDNVDAGTATAVITGSGYWTGSCEVEFQIARAAASYELPTGLTATAGQKLSDVELPEGFSWDDPSAYIGSTGEYGLSWAGDANHEGATGLTATVSVTRGVEGSMFSVASDGLAYTGEALEPAVSSDVVPDGSYTVTYRDNVDAGTATAVVTGSGFWTGSCELEFEIVKAPASYKLPTGLTAVCGQTLADVALPKGFSWDDPTITIDAPGENEYGLSWAGDENHEGATGLTATVDVTLPVEEGVDRIYGETRYETAGALVAEGSYASGGAVVIACGENFPDALSASSLAGDLGAPIVLTSQGYLPSATRERISELMPSKVYIMGGTAAVSSSVESEVRALAAPGCEVVRVAGDTRYDTNVEAVEALSGKSDTVIVACGTGFADALSISPYAYATSSPIVLCDSSALSDVAMAAISEGGYSHAIIVGGDDVVPSRVEGQLASLGVSDIRRLAGDTRYETSAEIVRFELSADVGITMDGITLASGENFPDALAAGPLSARRLAPLLLVDPSGDRAASFLSTYRGSVGSASIVGGNAAVGESAARKISEALGVSLS